MPWSRLTSRRLPAWLIGGNSVVMLLVVALSWIALMTSQRSFEQRAQDASDNVARSLSQAIDAQLDRIDGALRAVALEHNRPSAASRPMAERLRLQATLLDGLADLHVSDAQGRVEPGTGLPSDRNVATEDYFTRARDALDANEAVLGGLGRNEGGRWEIVLARRLRGPDGGFDGIVFACIPVSNFQQLLAGVNLGPDGAVGLRLLPSLALVARHAALTSGVPNIGTQIASDELARTLREHPQAGSYTARNALDQVERANAYRRLEGYPLLVLVGVGKADYLAQWRAEVGLVGALCVLTAALLLGSTALVLRARQRELASRQSMQASEAFLDRTGRIAAVGGWELDMASGIVTWSDQTCRLLDVAPGHRPHIDDALLFVAPQAREEVRARLRDGQPGTTWMLDMPLVTATGRPIWARVVAEVEGEGGRVRRVAGAVQDITEQRRNKAELAREQALRAQIEAHARELDTLVSERGEMLDVLAHEVRQPLNNASAALQSAAVVLAEVDEPAASLRLSRAQSVMNQVLGRLDNTLAVASLLARPDPIAREDSDVDALVAVAVADMPADQRARVQVERATTTRTASMDMSLMRLALRNLLSNALRHGPADTPVTVRLSDSDQPLALVIEVIDAGPGVPAELVPRLFERGARGSRHGHGLGLYIVRRVMELHEGRVELACNEPGRVTMRLVVVQERAE